MAQAATPSSTAIDPFFANGGNEGRENYNYLRLETARNVGDTPPSANRASDIRNSTEAAVAAYRHDEAALSHGAGHAMAAKTSAAENLVWMQAEAVGGNNLATAMVVQDLIAGADTSVQPDVPGANKVVAAAATNVARKTNHLAPSIIMAPKGPTAS